MEEKGTETGSPSRVVQVEGDVLRKVWVSKAVWEARPPGGFGVSVNCWTGRTEFGVKGPNSSPFWQQALV